MEPEKRKKELDRRAAARPLRSGRHCMKDYLRFWNGEKIVEVYPGAHPIA
jgi:hypothetical protein